MTTSSSSDSGPESAEPGSEQSKIPRNKTRRRLIWLGSITLFIIVVLVALPIVTARVATAWLQDNGANGASIENIDINLFTGRVRLVGLEASGGAQQRLRVGEAEVNVRWWPLTSKRIYVEALRLSDTQIDVSPDDQGNWQVGGLRFSPANETPEPETAPAEFDWGIGSEIINFSNVSITYQDALFDTDVEIHNITIGSQFSWLTGAETELVVDLDVNDSPINLRSTLVPWGEVQRITGNLQMTDHALSDHAQVLQELAGLNAARGSVSMDLEVSASMNEAGVLNVVVTGPLAISDIGFTLDTLGFSNRQLDWQGQIDVRIPVIDNDPLVTVEGGIQLAGTEVTLTDLELETSLAALDYDGRFDLFAAQDASQAPTFSLAAMLSGQGLAMDHGQLAYELARLESFALNDIQLDDLQQASLQQVQLRNLRLMSDQASGDNAETGNDTTSLNKLLSVAQLDLDQLTYAANSGVIIESVSLGEPVISIVRQAGGDIARVSELLAVFAGEAEPEAEPGQEGADAQPETTTPLSFAVNKLQVTSTDFLAVEDRAVMPPVNFRLSALELLVNNINSGSSDPMSVELTTGNDTLQLAVTGDVAAFAEPMSVNLMANVSALELPRFSPYIPGYNIDRGRLSVESSVAITGEMLDIQNSVLLEAIQLAGKAAEGNAILAQGMAMPLDVALDLLRDGDDRIELDLPVTGSLSDPQFNSADIIRTVMQNALQNAAMSYVTNALQPLGTLLFLGDLASQAAAPRFEPLSLSAGEHSLSNENRDYLLKIGELFEERPRLQLTLCGIVTQADREVLSDRALARLQQEAQATVEQGSDEGTGQAADQEVAPPQISDGELLELAAMRTRTATGFLADTAMIESDRLFTCRETIDAAEDAQPRVRLSL